MSEKTVERLKDASASGDVESMRLLGIIYRDGKGVEKSLTESVVWLRKASAKGSGAASVQLMDVLMNIGDADSLSEMLMIAHKFADEGNGDGMIRLGRAYRTGKGVEKNLEMAAQWFANAASSGVKWATNELFDTFWQMNTPESNKHMTEVIRPYAQSGNPGANARLGRAYHIGRGIKKNDDIAQALMHFAYLQGCEWIKEELNQLQRDLSDRCTEKMLDVTTVYHVGHYGFFWKYLIHYFSRPRRGKALFLFNTTVICNRTVDFINSLKENFSDIGYVETYREDSFFKETEELVREHSLGYFDSFFIKRGIKISECDIYTGFDAISSFAGYLSAMKIPFTMCDPGNGDLLKNRYHLETNPVIVPFTNYSEKAKTLNPDNRYTKDILCFSKTYYKFEKTVTFFDCDEMMSFMTRSQIERIYEIFNIDKISENTDVKLLVCSSAWIMMRKLTELQYIKIYADLIDYSLGEQHIIVKLHPNADFKGQWEKYFNISDIICGYVPTQILFSSGKLKPKMILSTGSMGSNISSPLSIDLTPAYLDSFRLINKVYFTFECLKGLGISNLNSELYNFGFLSKFLNLVGIRTNVEKGISITLKEIKECKISECDVSESSDVIALYSADGAIVDIYNRHISKLLKFKIHKEFITENLTGESDEFFFLFVKDEELKKKIQNIKVKKYMFHSKEWISVFSVDSAVRL